jgi:heat shock protein HslJ
MEQARAKSMGVASPDDRCPDAPAGAATSWFAVAVAAAFALGCAAVRPPPPEPADATYLIAGAPASLADSGDGGSAAVRDRVLVHYVGNDVIMDLDGDGREDRAFIVTHQPGGSGTFFYLVAALARPAGAVGSQGVLIGDRIVLQSVDSAGNARVVVDYADRLAGEPFTTPPSHGRSLTLQFDPVTLSFGQLVGDLPGEADPARMTLMMKSWFWIRATAADGVVSPGNEAFSRTFANDGTFAATTDCNSLRGKVTVSGSALRFHDTVSTRMHCAGSRESLFVGLLTQVDGFRFTARGELILESRAHREALVFR